MRKKVQLATILLLACLITAVALLSVRGTPVKLISCTDSCSTEQLTEMPFVKQLLDTLEPVLPERLSSCLPQEPESPWQYALLDDGTVEVTGYTGTLTALTIPTELDGLAVTRIGGHAFDGTAVGSVVIPEGVTSIGDHAFKLTCLRSVTLPRSLERIGGGAFSYCEQLTTIDLPASVTAIGSSAFYGCTALASLHLPDGLDKLSDNLVGNCWALTELEIPDSVTAIGYGVFFRCYALAELIVPEGVTVIRGAAFADCDALGRITILNPDTELGDELFQGGSTRTVVCAKSGSTAEAYARKVGLTFEPYIPGAAD